jgi:predicted CopG family antitoxin
MEAMATKTISIDMEAYRRLKAAGRDNESFSQTIKRVVRPPVDLDELVRRIEKVGADVWENVEQVVNERRAPQNLVTRKRRSSSR